MFNNQTKLLQCIGVMKNLEFGKINESFKNSVFLQIQIFKCKTFYEVHVVNVQME